MPVSLNVLCCNSGPETCFHEIFISCPITDKSPSWPFLTCFPFVFRTQSYQEEEDDIDKEKRREKEQRTEDNEEELQLWEWFNPK